MILFAVVVVIVLTVVLLVVNPLTLFIFGLLQILAHLLGHHTVGLGLVFLGLKPVLPLLKVCRFFLGQRTGLDALLNALLLIDLMLMFFSWASHDQINAWFEWRQTPIL